MVTEKKMKLSSPWVMYADAVKEMFRLDKEVDVEYDDEAKTIKLRVANAVKADALSRLLPEKKDFGGVIVYTIIIPDNKANDPVSLFVNAFSGNLAVSNIQTITEAFTNKLTYISFVPEVVQYWCDNLGDLHGNRTTLYQDLAKEVFGNHDGILFCTDAIKE